MKDSTSSTNILYTFASPSVSHIPSHVLRNLLEAVDMLSFMPLDRQSTRELHLLAPSPSSACSAYPGPAIDSMKHSSTPISSPQSSISSISASYPGMPQRNSTLGIIFGQLSRSGCFSVWQSSYEVQNAAFQWRWGDTRRNRWQEPQNIHSRDRRHELDARPARFPPLPNNRTGWQSSFHHCEYYEETYVSEKDGQTLKALMMFLIKPCDGITKKLMKIAQQSSDWRKVNVD